MKTMTTESFPEFENERWRIRKFSEMDLPLVQKASDDPLIPLITSVPKIFSEDEGRSYIKRQLSRYEEGTGYSFAIAELMTDNAVGSVYLSLKNIDEGRASVGYWIIQDFRKQGIAKACLKQVVEWAQNEIRIPRLELYAEPWNIGSIKTAEAAGFKQEGLMRSWQKVGDKRKDMIMMSNIL